MICLTYVLDSVTFLKHLIVSHYHGIYATHNQPCGEHQYIVPIEVARTNSLSTSENMQVFALRELHSASRNINPVEITPLHQRGMQSLFMILWRTVRALIKMELCLKHITNITLIFINVQMNSNNSGHVIYGLDNVWRSEIYQTYISHYFFLHTSKDSFTKI